MVVTPWLRVLGSVVLAIAVIAGGTTVVGQLPLHARDGHAAGHVVIGGGMVIFLASAMWLWPRPARAAQAWLRRALALGFALLLVGNLTEFVGAFGWALDDGYAVVNQPLSTVHDMGVYFSRVGFVAIVVGTLGSLGVWVWFMNRRGGGGAIVP